MTKPREQIFTELQRGELNLQNSVFAVAVVIDTGASAPVVVVGSS